MSQVPANKHPWSLAGKSAIVTGGSRGIGRAIALHLVRKGVKRIVVTYSSDAASAEETVSQCRDLGAVTAAAVKADLLDPDIGTSLVRKALEQLNTKTIDIVVNNAALTDPSKWQPAAVMSLDVFSQNMQANVFAAISIIKAVLPYLPEAGGRVINISSIASKTANPDPNFIYGASKAALDSITRSFALSHAAQRNATFNSVNVGVTDTQSLRNNMAALSVDEAQLAGLATAGRRLGNPDDVAFVVGFLASDEARWVNGAAVPANGGTMSVLALQG